MISQKKTKPVIEKDLLDYLEGIENHVELPHDWLSSCKTTKAKNLTWNNPPIKTVDCSTDSELELMFK